MTKQSGLGDNCYVAGNNLSGDVSTIALAGPQTTQDVTGIDVFAMERRGLVRDGSITWTSFFNPTRAHPVLSALPTADVVVTYCRGTTLGKPSACMVAKQINYDGTRADGGEFTFSLQAQANGFGLEWGNQLTAGVRSDTAATNGTGVDFTAATSFGWQAYLQVFSITGTSVTVTIKDSADNSTFTALTGGAFTAATTAGTQRLQGGSTATVRQYVRVDTTGTFSAASFAVTFVKNETAVAF